MALVLAIALSAAAFGQASAINGQILGTVTDAAGEAVAGAKVTAANINTGFQQSVDTEPTGLYRFNVLPLGRYDVRVEASGFAPLKQTGIEVNAGATVTLGIRLEVKGVTTEVVVTSSSPVIDPSRTDTGRQSWRLPPKQLTAGIPQSFQFNPATTECDGPREY